jgi:dynactin 1
MSDLRIGQTVELADGRIAVIRFIGQPHFAAGDWVGVELEDDSGKNDGSVQGERYFDCEMGRGMFVRPAAMTILEQPAEMPKPVAKKPVRPASAVISGRPRMSSVADTTAGKRMSMNAASPSPATRPRPGSMLRVCPL